MPTEEYTNKNIEEYKNFLKNDKYKKEKLKCTATFVLLLLCLIFINYKQTICWNNDMYTLENAYILNKNKFEHKQFKKSELYIGIQENGGGPRSSPYVTYRIEPINFGEYFLEKSALKDLHLISTNQTGKISRYKFTPIFLFTLIMLIIILSLP
ncbi:MAG: hypothetical protein ACI4B8_06320 [Candidatus Gastranaerophilaceae bacterium]